MIEAAPLRFHPYLKSVIWGGDKIYKYKNLNPDGKNNIGESWEISALPGYESVVAEGKYQGYNLLQLIEEFGEELLGKKVAGKYNNKFPLLIKFIDANDNLSVQVHPNDELAMKRHGSLGKTEMWYIIDSKENAKIFSGLNRRLSPKEFEALVAKNKFESVLKIHESNKGDIFFLPSGYVHAIGAGNLLAEIQESSDITYRIYDYNRKGADGKPRELHTDLAKDAIDYKINENSKKTHVPQEETYAEIAKCEHFTTHRLFLDGEKILKFDPSSFSVIICIEGEAELEYRNGRMIVARGTTLLIPAVLSEINLKGKSTLLITQS